MVRKGGEHVSQLFMHEKIEIYLSVDCLFSLTIRTKHFVVKVEKEILQRQKQRWVNWMVKLL